MLERRGGVCFVSRVTTKCFASSAAPFWQVTGKDTYSSILVVTRETFQSKNPEVKYIICRKKNILATVSRQKCFSDVRFSKYRCSRLTTIQALCMSIQKQLDTNRFDSSTNYPLHITSILPFPKPICILSQSECHSANSFAHRGQ